MALNELKITAVDEKPNEEVKKQVKIEAKKQSNQILT